MLPQIVVCVKFIIMKSITIAAALALVSLMTLLACSKKNDDKSPDLLMHNLQVESIIAPGGVQSVTNRCFINLYEGVAFTKSEAEAASSKVDFAYNYHGGGCSSCRFFENVTSMSTRTGYVQSFSTITNSQLANVEKANDVTIAQFDALKTQDDVDKLFAEKTFTLYGSADVTNRVTDAAVGRVFAFTDKEGRKGLFKIGDYIANVPNGDKATLQLTIKIVP